MLGQFVDEDHKAEELQDVAHGARHDCRRVREPHLLVRPGAQILEVAVQSRGVMIPFLPESE